MTMWVSKGATRYGIREVEPMRVAGKSVSLMIGEKLVFMSLGREIHETREQAVAVARERYSQQVAGLQKRVDRLQKQIDKLETTMKGW